MTTEQDPHKHPLYMPHMGDMTGFRFLEVGERLQADDEHNWREKGNYSMLNWMRVSGSSNDFAVEGEAVVYRRRVTAESKPVEQKRFSVVANKLARAITDTYNRTGQIPSESELEEAIIFVMEQNL